MNKQTIKFSVYLLLVAAMLFGSASPAAAGPFTNADFCDSNGGVWEPNPANPDSWGICWYEIGHPFAHEDCNDALLMTSETWGDGIEGEIDCGLYTPPVVETTSKTVANPLGRRHCEDTEDAGSIGFNGSGGRWGSVNYDAGSCTGKITIHPSLPGNAQNQLPENVQDHLYVRVVDENGDPAYGSYSICFAYDANEGGTIYRYLNGAWVEQAVFFSGGQICTSAYGSGAFALY